MIEAGDSTNHSSVTTRANIETAANRPAGHKELLQDFIRQVENSSSPDVVISTMNKILVRLATADLRTPPLAAWVAANRALEKFYMQPLNTTQVATCRKFLDQINIPIFLLSSPDAGYGLDHEVQPGETLSWIARNYKIYPDRIIRYNNIANPNAIQAGMKLRIIPGPIKIVILRKGFYLNAYINKVLFKHYPIAVGERGHTPKTKTSVSSSLARNPDYTNDQGIIIPNDSPENPVGTRWIGLELGRGFGIHGTRNPESIGKAKSKGCIRMLNSDVEELFDYVMTGDPVHIL